MATLLVGEQVDLGRAILWIASKDSKPIIRALSSADGKLVLKGVGSVVEEVSEANHSLFQGNDSPKTLKEFLELLSILLGQVLLEDLR